MSIEIWQHSFVGYSRSGNRFRMILASLTIPLDIRTGCDNTYIRFSIMTRMRPLFLVHMQANDNAHHNGSLESMSDISQRTFSLLTHSLSISLSVSLFVSLCLCLSPLSLTTQHNKAQHSTTQHTHIHTDRYLHAFCTTSSLCYMLIPYKHLWSM